MNPGELRARLASIVGAHTVVYGEEIVGILEKPPVPAAVLVPIILGDEPSLLLTRRTAHLKSHAGQVSFPGGRIDPEDRDAEAAALRADIAKAAADIAERLIDSARDAGDDEAEAGAKAFEREHELAVTQNAEDLLDQGERARHRIDGGTYGVCESCGNPIGKARLLAFPRATLCVACKQRQERR